MRNMLFERKLWNKGFGTETPIPQLSFKKYAEKNDDNGYSMNIKLLNEICCLKESCGIGVSVPKPLFHNFPSRKMQKRK